MSGVAAHLHAVHQLAVTLVATNDPASVQLAHASAWAVFIVGATLSLAGAMGVVVLRKPVHSALMLVVTLFGIALLFVDESADFLAAVQIIVYAGAIVILFLFVIMLLGVDKTDMLGRERLRSLTPIGLVVSIIAVIEVVVLAQVQHWATGQRGEAGALNGPGENVQKLGESIFTRYLLPFEMTSALLLIAVVGAVVLARRKERTAGEMSLEQQRGLREGARR
jgi:NADH-quinone oxidoreductase subunit J